MINYTHADNTHTVQGALAALPRLFEIRKPTSLLDVGCGEGTWLRAALDLGINDVFGIDGVPIPANRLLFPPERFRCQDLSEPWQLGRQFDMALCLEVAEHLPESAGGTLIQCLTQHAETIYFSGAIPGQDGQGHINCRWPDYWQSLFNEHGFTCADIRAQLWHDDRIEPWYRQNIFIARHDPAQAGKEERLCALVHPAMLEIEALGFISGRKIEDGRLPTSWYVRVPFKAVLSKAKRRVGLSPK